jgi:hypothetical protein
MELINYIYVLAFYFSFIRCENIQLEKLSTLYIPSSYAKTGSPVFSMEGGSAEQSAYDSGDQMVYIVGKLSSYRFKKIIHTKHIKTGK